MEPPPNDKIYALVDCNNFYASCERVFRPELRGIPVIVLSNNDGRVIARSEEAKALGIKMGAPYFQLKELIDRNNVQVFSTNFALYGDMSRRVKGVLEQFSPHIENYSIDESFLDLTQFHRWDLEALGHEIRERVYQWTGIPVSIGIARTKTLAKAANRIAKKVFHGVFSMIPLHEHEIDQHLERLDVGDIWGVGRAQRKKLVQSGLTTAKHFKYLEPQYVKESMNVTMKKTILELRGIACIHFKDAVQARKGIACTRTFGQYVQYPRELHEAVSLYTARAAEKLRKQKSIAGSITVFVHTNWHNPELPQYYNSHTIKLSSPTSYTPVLTKHALQALDHIYILGYFYHKAGVILSDIIPQDRSPDDLFTESTDHSIYKKRSVIHSIDQINQRWGRGTINSLAQGTKRTWFVRQSMRSPRYTTHWLELPSIR